MKDCANDCEDPQPGSQTRSHQIYQTFEQISGLSTWSIARWGRGALMVPHGTLTQGTT